MGYKLEDFKTIPEYIAIEKFYINKRSIRTQQPYIKHINEGLLIMDYLNHDWYAMKAFCIHPLVQEDSQLLDSYRRSVCFGYGYAIPPTSWMLAMEYRRVANSFLSGQLHPESIDFGPLPEIKEMLIADKIQNFKELIKYYNRIGKNAPILHAYFESWLEFLNVSWDKFNEVIKFLEDTK